MNLGEKSTTAKTVYHDNFIDRLFIAFFCRKMAIALGQQQP